MNISGETWLRIIRRRLRRQCVEVPGFWPTHVLLSPDVYLSVEAEMTRILGRAPDHDPWTVWGMPVEVVPGERVVELEHRVYDGVIVDDGPGYLRSDRYLWPYLEAIPLPIC